MSIIFAYRNNNEKYSEIMRKGNQKVYILIQITQNRRQLSLGS